MDNNGDPHSYVNTIRDIYRTSPTDFRWSMSSAEFSYFQWLLEVRDNLMAKSASKVAVVRGTDVDCVVFFLKGGVFIECYPLNGQYFGRIVISGVECDLMTNVEVAMHICKSLEWTNGTN
jgi:hypothetical protein